MKYVKTFESFTLNERNWIYTLDLTAPFKAYDVEEDAIAFAKNTAEIIENKYDEIQAEVGEDAAEEVLSRVVEELYTLGQDADESSVDYVLEELYNWADLYDVWINKEF